MIPDGWWDRVRDKTIRGLWTARYRAYSKYESSGEGDPNPFNVSEAASKLPMYVDTLERFLDGEFDPYKYRTMERYMRFADYLGVPLDTVLESWDESQKKKEEDRLATIRKHRGL